MTSFCINLLSLYIYYCFISTFYIYIQYISKNISENTKEFSNIKYINYQDDFYITNKLNSYDPKYYIQGNYLYSIVNNNNTCLDSCLLWVNNIIPTNAIAVTGFNILHINETKCECKGQVLHKKKN